MAYLLTTSAVLLFLSVFCIALVFVLYPLSLAILSLIKRRERAADPNASLPTVSLLIVARNAEDLIGDKLENAFSLNYPAELLDVIVFSDGSTDRTEEIVKAHAARESRLKFFSSRSHQGKANGLNTGMASCTGEIVVLSDVDAMLGEESVNRIITHFADPEVGGVCGQRAISSDTARMKDAQSRYIGLDSRVKLLESRIGSITSNDGKLYAIRRRLFKPIAIAVTDDLYSCLSIVEQHFRFVFEPGAVASIKVPSRSSPHELSRRRRIVCRSLTGIFMKKSLLNPLRYGFYSVGLFCNKIVRRALPLCLLVLLATSLHLAFYYKLAIAMLALQLAFYALACSYPLLERWRSNPLRKLGSTAFYFCLGNYGTLMGAVDFIRGHEISQWDPVKRDVTS